MTRYCSRSLTSHQGVCPVDEKSALPTSVYLGFSSANLSTVDNLATVVPHLDTLQ